MLACVGMPCGLTMQARWSSSNTTASCDAAGMSAGCLAAPGRLGARTLSSNASCCPGSTHLHSSRYHFNGARCDHMHVNNICLEAKLGWRESRQVGKKAHIWISASRPSRLTRPRRSARLAAVVVGNCAGSNSHSATATLKPPVCIPTAAPSAALPTQSALRVLEGTTADATTAYFEGSNVLPWASCPSCAGLGPPITGAVSAITVAAQSAAVGAVTTRIAGSLRLHVGFSS